LIELLQQAMIGLGGTGPVETDWRGHIHRSRRAIESRSTLAGAGSGGGTTDDANGDDLYRRLRSWRDRKARAGGVPPHVIVSDHVLRIVARQRPTTTAQLAAVTNLRPAKLARLGPDILAQIDAARAAVES
jgi:superfamily II DNA helicase RecQ